VGRQGNYDVSHFLEEGVAKPMRYFLLVIIILQLTPFVYAVEVLYAEQFTGNGDVSAAGWNGVYSDSSSGGVVGGFAWVWHDANNHNLIYTTEYTVDTDTDNNVSFEFQLRRHSGYSSTPEVSIAVQVGGNWYISKTVFAETSVTFNQNNQKIFDYDPDKSNWDTLNFSTLARGSTPASDLSGDITAFGLYSDSQNVGGACTAEYDNFKIFGETIQVNPDFNGDGCVDSLDLVVLANSWLCFLGQPCFNENCDLDGNNRVDAADFGIFAGAWLSGAKYPYIGYKPIGN